MPKASAVADLRRHLGRTEMITVKDSDGSEWRFEVKPVWPMAWDPTNEWYTKLISTDPNAFQDKMAEVVAAPPLAVFRDVLVRGVHSPKVLERDGKAEDAIWVEDLMRRDLLARDLYAHIAQLSLRGVVKVEKKPHGDSPRSSS